MQKNKTLTISESSEVQLANEEVPLKRTFIDHLVQRLAIFVTNNVKTIRKADDPGLSDDQIRFWVNLELRNMDNDIEEATPETGVPTLDSHINGNTPAPVTEEGKHGLEEQFNKPTMPDRIPDEVVEALGVSKEEVGPRDKQPEPEVKLAPDPADFDEDPSDHPTQLDEDPEADNPAREEFVPEPEPVVKPGKKSAKKTATKKK